MFYLLISAKSPIFVVSNYLFNITTMRYTNITATRAAVMNHARKLYFSETVPQIWSLCVSLAWAYQEVKEKVKQGLPVTFIKKTTGEERTVNKPAPYVHTPKEGTASTRVTPPYIVVFNDTEKEGHQTVSLDIRTLK